MIKISNSKTELISILKKKKSKNMELNDIYFQQSAFTNDSKRI